MARSRRRPECGANTGDGGSCSNYRDTCPHPSHETSRPTEAFKNKAASAWKLRQPGAPGTALADDPALLARMCREASQHYNLAAELIEHDYWLIATLFAWTQTVGGSRLRRPYLSPERQDSAGRVVFAGGTSLSAAWDVSPRWSADIDLILDPEPGLSDRTLRAACKYHAVRAAAEAAATCRVTERGPGHFFFEAARSSVDSRVDMTFRRLAGYDPAWVATRTVFSLVGRIADQDVLDSHRELGGFKVQALGPGLTMVDKLLAQTMTASSGDPDLIRERARDIYDLACIARERSRFEGHIGRDTRYLLHLSQTHHPSDDPRRPPEGFASLRTFDPSTAEYEALAEGYQAVAEQMVWGDRIPLNEAIGLAVSLDEGPAKEWRPPGAVSRGWG